MGPLRYIDVVLLVVAAPILLLIGVSALGYAVSAGVWLGLRVVEIGVNRYAAALGDQKRELIVRQLMFPLVRIFLLALTVILVRRGEGKDAGLTALVLLVLMFTIRFAISVAERPRAR
jgi:hypothetical protein